jgi:hypothetical protein
MRRVGMDEKSNRHTHNWHIYIYALAHFNKDQNRPIYRQERMNKDVW